MPTIAAHTLGCKVNQYDTQKILEQFRTLGFVEVPFTQFADLYLINSCSVTHVAEHKSRQFVAKILKRNPRARVIVAGCYSRLDADRVRKIPGVMGIIQDTETLAPLDLDEIVQGSMFNVQRSIPSTNLEYGTKNLEPRTLNLEQGRIRRNLVIQTGCEQFCAYCIIPYARGELWSKPLGDILSEARKMVKEDGVKEIILTGINMGTYNQQLTTVIESLSEIKGLLRIRLSSIEPQHWTDELLETIQANPKVCHHFHIPLQSGCDRTLQRMNRPYSANEYAARIQTINRQFPDAAVTSDVIVGFPGETDGDFQQCQTFIESQGFAQLHVFKFSSRKGTPAADMAEPLPSPVIQHRAKQLQALNQTLTHAYQKRFQGRELEVLWESFEKKTATLTGLTGNYQRVKKQGVPDKVGTLELVKISNLRF